MKFNPAVEYIWTEDDIRLQGMYYWVEDKDAYDLMIHDSKKKHLTD